MICVAPGQGGGSWPRGKKKNNIYFKKPGKGFFFEGEGGPGGGGSPEKNCCFFKKTITGPGPRGPRGFPCFPPKKTMALAPNKKISVPPPPPAPGKKKGGGAAFGGGGEKKNLRDPPWVFFVCFSPQTNPLPPNGIGGALCRQNLLSGGDGRGSLV